MSPVFSTIALALALANGVHAFFRINCDNIQRGRIDPLVNPGALAAHSHSIVGGSNIGVNATFNSLVNSRCTSCEVSSDKSAYWSPTLYYKYPNGSFYEVHHDGAVVYYLGRGPNVNQTIPFPEGFMILSGDKSARSYDNTTMTYGTKDYPGRPVADRVSFNCINEGTDIVEKYYMHNTNCKYGMRAQIHFQSCWNGKELYKQDNSHVAYQSSIDNGICPPTHPIQLPHIFLEVFYDVALVPEQSEDGLFVFSQGDPTGYGFHADFQNGWEPDALANATANCLATDDFGQISNCPVLQKDQSLALQYNCPERPPQVDEPVKGLIDKLPGCVQITYGPEAATSASMNCAPSVPKPVIRQTIDSVAVPTIRPTPGDNYPVPNQKYLGCYNDSAGSNRPLNAYFVANYTFMTVQFCQDICANKGYRLSGVEYSQECHCDNYINPTAITDEQKCSWNCGGTMNSDIVEVCGGYGYMSIYNNTASLEDDPRLAPSAPKPSVGKYKLRGCLTDPNQTGRVLNGTNYVNNEMTNDMCVKYCLGELYHYSGIEYGIECWCGNDINAASGGQMVDCPLQGIMNCGGNSKQQCGGPNLLTYFYSDVL